MMMMMFMSVLGSAAGIDNLLGMLRVQPAEIAAQGLFPAMLAPSIQWILCKLHHGNVHQNALLNTRIKRDHALLCWEQLPSLVGLTARQRAVVLRQSWQVRSTKNSHNAF
jgi:hypothetical protein